MSFIIKITNTSDSTLNSKLGSGESYVVSQGGVIAVKENKDGRITDIYFSPGNYNAFSSGNTAGFQSIPQYSRTGTGNARLLVEMWYDENTFFRGGVPSLTNE